jgi:hypothetical protein
MTLQRLEYRPGAQIRQLIFFNPPPGHGDSDQPGQRDRLGYVGLMTVMWAAVLVVAGFAAPGASNGSLGTLLWSFPVCTPVAGVPLACAVAVLKYQPYEIDRIISRTLAYAIVTGLLAGIYAGPMLLTTQVFRLTTVVFRAKHLKWLAAKLY